MRLLHRAPPASRLPRLPPRLARRRAWGPSTPDEVIKRSAAGDGWVSANALGGWYPALMAHDEIEGLQVLGRHPVRVLVGELDRVTPVRFTEAIADALPHAEVDVLPARGHMLAKECPDLVVRHLLELLAAGAPPRPPSRSKGRS
jgi:pimeloyl-ACP methyl ester carboxylesterase